MQAPAIFRLTAFAEPLGRAGDEVRRAAFWIAATLPFVYLPLLALEPYIHGYTGILIGAIGLNVLALVLGHSYDPHADRSHEP